MTRETSRIAKGIFAGVVIGTAVSAVALSSMKPKKNTLKRKTVNALDTVGSIMQNIAEYSR